MTTAPHADQQLRDRIAEALSESGAFCGECGFEPGEIGCPDCVRVRDLYTDAVLATVEPELDHLRAERDQFADRVDTLTAVCKGNKRHVQEMYLDLQKAQAEVEQLRAENQKMRAIQAVQTDWYEAVLLISDRDPDAAENSSAWHEAIGYNDALSAVRDAFAQPATPSV